MMMICPLNIIIFVQTGGRKQGDVNSPKLTSIRCAGAAVAANVGASRLKQQQHALL